MACPNQEALNEEINKSHRDIKDFSHRNPSTFYELGSRFKHASSEKSKRMGEQSGGNLICVLESCMQVFEVKSVQFDWIVVILYDSQVQRLEFKAEGCYKI